MKVKTLSEKEMRSLMSQREALNAAVASLVMTKAIEKIAALFWNTGE